MKVKDTATAYYNICYGIKESYEQINSAALSLKWIQNFHGTNFTIIHGSTKENEKWIVKSFLLISKPGSLRAKQLIARTPIIEFYVEYFMKSLLVRCCTIASY